MTTESSTEKQAEKADATKAPAENEDKKVPLAALGESRAKTRAANERAEKLEQELAKAKEQQVPIDMDALMNALADEARRKVEAEVAPLRNEVNKYKMAANMGLNESQVDKVMGIRDKNPGLTEQQALILAKTEHPDVFPQAAPATWNRALHGAMPVGGASDARSNPQAEDLTAKMHEARKNKDFDAAQNLAEREAIRRFTNVYEASKRSPRS